MIPLPKYNEKAELDTRLRVDPLTGDVGIGTPTGTAWQAYMEVQFSPDLILRWIREGDFYVSRIDKELMEKLKNTVGGDKNENQRRN
jgi:hypothetical protein